MKKLILSFIAALMAFAASAEFNVGQLRYEVLQSGEVECKGFTSTALAQNPTTVTIPGRVTSSGTVYKVYNIAANAFNGNTSLRSVYVDWGIVEIGHDAFNGCTNLYSVRLPSTITTIETYAFANCTSMGVFGIAATTRPYVASSAFSGMKKCNVHVATEDARTLYNASTIWRNIAIGSSVLRTPNLACDFTAANRYYIIHTGRNVASSSANATLIGVADNVTYIPITSVVDNMPVTYGNCSSGYTANVTRIAPYACQNNTKLTSVGRSDLGAYTGFEEVGDYAFDGCSAITFVGIPCGKIGYAAFKYCTALTSVQLYSTNDMDGGVDNLGGEAFYGCSQLKELLLSNTRHVLTLGVNAFAQNHSTFKCYVPIKHFYSNYTSVSNWSSSGAASAAEKVHPFIAPKTEWTAISCFKPITLNYDNNAHYYTVTATTQGVASTATMQRISLNYVEAGTGLLMQATPGVIYRFTTRSSGVSVGTNLLKGVNGSQEWLNNQVGAYRYIFNPTTKVFDELSGSNNVVYSGEAYLETSQYYTSDGHIYPDGTSTVYNLTINGKPVTSANAADLSVLDGVSGTVNYNPETRTLTLNNATVTGRINTQQNGIVINALGNNTVESIRLYVQNGSNQDYEVYTITGTGKLNVNKILACANVNITGGVKLNVTGEGSYNYSIDAILYEVSNPYNIYANITISGQGTEMRVASNNGMVHANTFTMNDGHYIAKPQGASFKPHGYNDTYGYFVDIYGNELRNAELLVTDAAPRGFKYNGLWYEQTGTNTVQVIEAQQGEVYTGDVVIPEVFTRGTQVYVVNKIDACAFSGTTVTGVEVPASVTSIGDKAFYGAQKLKSLVLLPDKAPNKYTLLGENFVGNNASGFACYVKNNTLLTWMQTYTSINLLPWVVTNSDNGFLTFSCARNVTLPSGLTAYRVSGFDQARRMAITTKLTNSRIPSKNGVILKGEPGVRYLLTGTTSAPAVGDNMLRSLLVTGDIPYAPLATNPDDTKAYFLGNSCHQWNEFQNNIDLFMTLNTGIAYLAVDKTLLGNDYTSPVQLDLWSTTTLATGDVNGDTVVDIEDINAIINIVLGTIPQGVTYPGNADFNGQGGVDVEDLNALINIILTH